MWAGYVCVVVRGGVQRAFAAACEWAECVCRLAASPSHTARLRLKRACLKLLGWLVGARTLGEPHLPCWSGNLLTVGPLYCLLPACVAAAAATTPTTHHQARHT